ncbi:MAG: alginate lyase family protein [Pseudomonadota bacterium]
MNQSLFSRTRRTWDFARHIPITKLLRRMELNLRRRIRDQVPIRAKPNLPAICVSPRPYPLFAPRSKQALRIAPDGKLQLTLLNHPVELDLDDLDWGAPGPGPQNQLWRMNLHYMEYLEGVQDSLWARLVSDWITKNGMCGCGAWRDSWNSYALSLRVVVWLQDLARRGDRLPADLVSMVERSAVQQVEFLENNLETDLGGNHLIKNIKALIWAGHYFCGTSAGRWKQKGIALLRRELSTQILVDGMHFERSPSYHCQVFADLLECKQALGEDPLDGALDSALHRMAQLVADLAHPDGHVAQFNDAGLSMAYSPSDCLAAYAALGFQRPVSKRVFSYPDAGYFGMRSGTTYFVGDCGVIGPDDLPAHGHGDILSFEWSVGGQRIVVDQGVYEYVDGVRRTQSRSASYHNTLCIDGSDQAAFFGAFRCGRRPTVDCRYFEETDGGLLLEGCHDGFTTLPGRPMHARRFLVTPDRVNITDAITPGRRARAKVNFLLHPDVSASGDGAELELVSRGVRIGVEASRDIKCLPAVWWPDMGMERTTTRLQIELPSTELTSDVTFRVLR